MRLKEIFKDIQINKNDWLQSRTGDDFEQRMETILKKKGFNRILKEDIPQESFKIIKNKIQNKIAREYVENILSDKKEFIECFIFQPFGSQNFPDFLVFTRKYILAVEIKYSRNKAIKPMWNSNLPKNKAIYIFGSYSLKDVTFFLGRDILPIAERKELISFFEKVKKEEINFKLGMAKEMKLKKITCDRGFGVYIRRAYEQNKRINKKANLNYFSHPGRLSAEKAVLNFCEKIN